MALVPDLNWETKERDGGDAVNWSVVIDGVKLPMSTQYLDILARREAMGPTFSSHDMSMLREMKIEVI